MNIIIWLICMWYAMQYAFASKLLLMPQPKELLWLEEKETYQGVTLGKDYIPNLNVNPLSTQFIIRTLAYGDGLTVKKMQHHEY